MHRVHAQVIRQMEVEGEEEGSTKVERGVWNGIMRLVPKVFECLSFCNLRLGRRQLEVLMNSLGKVGTLRFQSCLVDMENLQIRPTRNPEITKISFYYCYYDKIDDEIIPMNLKEFFICVSASSLGYSLRNLYFKECGYLKKDVQNLANKYLEDHIAINVSSKIICAKKR
ncbi:unnamed protein product [Moneuplotes crassus]|uniref:Uncharacterized protein n=1 Tax=Euplotes crassus TaxID=5936 RepID=A0AAD1XRW7_EUPCR|nr:unnamed protein product [Moneuplotes crassus]